ncbi:uncharacterized protein PAC_08152 [Phialocephala subalpina]|uniref:Uncharacterized protein n=1 Tax=Phialocephala subalpina TaxID=576137 RepID=A0A1L7WZQ6_9HELO|nr:uncharacterized protein PAC_08152 [Phialocephala subalpina]
MHSPRSPRSPRFRGSRPSFRPSAPRSRTSSYSSGGGSSDDGLEDASWTDTIGGVTIHLTKFGGAGQSPRCRAWKADMKVYLDAKGMGDYIRPDMQGDNFHYIEDEVLAKMDRERKAMIWFSVDEDVRREHLMDLCEREATSEDVWRRLHERLGADKPYEPLPPLSLDDQE